MIKIWKGVLNMVQGKQIGGTRFPLRCYDIEVKKLI